MRFFIFIFSFLILSGCGSGGNAPASISFSKTKSGGQIQLTVFDSKNTSLSKSLQVSQYKVILDGDGLSPVEQTVAADAGGVVIDGIPVGNNRRVQVKALNDQSKILREGVTEQITVEGGKLTDVAVSLQAIPVVLNVADKDHVSNRRLYFQIFSDPKHDVAVSEGKPLPDILTSLNRIPTNDQGIAKIYPGVLSPGLHNFTVQDATTGKSSSLSLNLWDGDKIKGAPLVAASNAKSRMGQGIGKR